MARTVPPGCIQQSSRRPHDSPELLKWFNASKREVPEVGQAPLVRIGASTMSRNSSSSCAGETTSTSTEPWQLKWCSSILRHESISASKQVPTLAGGSSSSQAQHDERALGGRVDVRSGPAWSQKAPKH